MKIKFAILFLLVSFLGFSQDMESMKIEIQKVYDYTIEKNYNAILDATYPKVFEIVPRTAMKEVMEKMFDNEEVTLNIEKVNPEFTYSEIMVIKGGKYCVVQHNNKMTMKFKQSLGDNKNAILESLKESMTNYNVSLDEKTETFIVDGKAKMIAISDKSTNGTWKYLNFNSESPMMEQVLGKEVLGKLGL